MKQLIVLGALLAMGIGAWQIGNRLSTDAVGMGVGLVFGTLALLPATVMVLATSGRRHDDGSTGEAWEAGYRAGIREANALALGTRPQLEQYDGPTIDGTLAPKYTHAHPFYMEVER